MRFVVKHTNGAAKEFQFMEGPVSIGRAADSHILLPDAAVSRQHAQIQSSKEGKWVVKDMDSAGKTYLNGKAIHEAEIKTGDCLQITDFTIEIDLEAGAAVPEPIHQEDTHLEASLAVPLHETVVRRPDAAHAPAMRLPSKRLTDFSHAAEVIQQAGSLEELLHTLVDINLEQFSAFHSWCGLREQPAGEIIYQAGKRRDGQKVELSEIQLQQKITQAVKRRQSLVLPRVSAQVEEKERIRSAVITAILRQKGCFGVLYVDNAMIHEHYSLSDLDYLMLIAINAAAVMGKLLNL
ncbi:MAG TPA: FHA domain-containing protein [Planctomycetes bacterium]|nr:FHA domain-containing protein [Planctomycetota bacterium]